MQEEKLAPYVPHQAPRPREHRTCSVRWVLVCLHLEAEPYAYWNYTNGVIPL